MNNEALIRLTSSTACNGAFRIVGEDLEPISAHHGAAKHQASRTRDLWCRVGDVVSDTGLMIAKRGQAMSIATRRGGVIVESEGAMNIGILRAALKDEAPVPAPSEAPTPGAPDTLNAIWDLMSWIAMVETPRLFLIDIAAERAELLVSKGKFAVMGKGSTKAISALLHGAVDSSGEITLGYGPLPKKMPDCALQPMDLLDLRATDDGSWSFAASGLLKAAPKTATHTEARDVSAMARSVLDWCSGEVSEITLIQDNMQQHVVAHSTGDGLITILPPQLN